MMSKGMESRHAAHGIAPGQAQIFAHHVGGQFHHAGFRLPPQFARGKRRVTTTPCCVKSARSCAAPASLFSSRLLRGHEGLLRKVVSQIPQIFLSCISFVFCFAKAAKRKRRDPPLPTSRRA
jgi:hypothetical protein